MAARRDFHRAGRRQRAEPGEICVTDPVVAFADPADFRFERLGQVTLKGVRDSMFLFRAVRC
jgi:hypothetical protein